MFTVAISGFDNYLNFSICTMYIALLMINKSLYVILDAYKKLVLQDQICLLLQLFLDFLLLQSSPLQNEAGQRLIEFCQENALVTANTLEKTLHMDLTRWSTLKSDWLYSLQPKMEKHYTVSKEKTGSWLWLGSWTPYCQIQTEIEESRKNH